MVVSLIVDDLDRKIIHALHLDPRRSFSALADLLGASEQTVARRYRRLRESGVVRVVGQLDTGRLGQSDWALRIRCAPDTTMKLALALAARPDTAWVQITSGGTEIVCTVRAHDEDQRTSLLLDQLPSSGRIIQVQAYRLIHMFLASDAPAVGFNDALSETELAVLASENRRPAGESTAESRPPMALRADDWPLVRALSEDGRATWRQLAARTNWHEATVRRRVEELVEAGLVYFDVDMSSEVMGVGTRAMLWMSVAPSKLHAVGTAMAEHREIPFLSATTGPTNLVASVGCRDDRALYEYLSSRVASLDGVNHIETEPIIRSVKRHATMEAMA